MTGISFASDFDLGIGKALQRRARIPQLPSLDLPEINDGDPTDVVARYNDLLPIGDTGIYITPNDPVDPTNCAEWPSSPYCEGGGPIVNPLTRPLAGATAEIFANECEVCITVQPVVLYMNGPPYTVCYRKPACRPGGGEPEVDAPDQLPDGPQIDKPIKPVAPPGYCRKLWAFHQISIAVNGNGDWASLPPQPGIGGGILPSSWQTWAFTSARTTVQRVDSMIAAYNNRRFPEGRSFDFQRTIYAWYDVPIGQPDPFAGNRQSFEKLVFDSCGAKPPAPAPPYRPTRPAGDDDMACNCDEIEDLLRAIYTRMGCEQYPVEVPQTLYGRNDKSQKLEDIPSLFAWWVYQFDALIGEWPIKVLIEDEDPTTLENQQREIELPNLAEATAELFGLTYKSDVTNDVLMEMLLRLIPEIIGIKNSSLITQDYAKANASWLGYKGNPEKRKIPYNFDAEKLDSLPQLMSSCEKEIIGWKDDDSENLVSYLQRLMFSAGIVKAALMRDKNQVASYIDSLRSLWNDLGETDDRWDDFIRRLDNPEDPINRGAIPKPDADKATPPE